VSPLEGTRPLRARSHHLPGGGDVAGGRRSVLTRSAVSVVVLLADILMLYAAVANVHGPARVVLGFALVGVMPGWSIVGLVRLGDPALEIGLTVAVSLAVCMTGTQVLLTLHAWHLVALQEALCLICIPSLVWQALALPAAREHPS
jgi:uncharacterized membrane protein